MATFFYSLTKAFLLYDVFRNIFGIKLMYARADKSVLEEHIFPVKKIF